MRTFKIINMSDPYTLVAADPLDACLACLFVGEGHYGLHEVGGQEFRMPVFLGAGADEVSEWVRQTFGVGLDAAITAHMAAIADCLDSVLIGDAEEREVTLAEAAQFADGTDRRQYLAGVHNRRRSSLDDIGTRAWAIGKALRKSAAEVTQ